MALARMLACGVPGLGPGRGQCHSSWGPLKQPQKRAEKAFLLPFQPRQNQYILET